MPHNIDIRQYKHKNVIVIILHPEIQLSEIRTELENIMLIAIFF